MTRRRTATSPRSSLSSRCASGRRIEVPPSPAVARAASTQPDLDEYRAPVPPGRRAVAVVLAADHGRRRARRDHPRSRGRPVCRRSTSDGRDVGMLELDFREPGECELAFVGLIPELSGKGHGRWLLAEALAPRLARRRQPRPRPHLLARSSGRAFGLRPRRFHAVQARDRAFPRSARCWESCRGLRPSGAALGPVGARPAEHRFARSSSRRSPRPRSAPPP